MSVQILRPEDYPYNFLPPFTEEEINAGDSESAHIEMPRTALQRILAIIFSLSYALIFYFANEKTLEVSDGNVDNLVITFNFVILGILFYLATKKLAFSTNILLNIAAVVTVPLFYFGYNEKMYFWIALVIYVFSIILGFYFNSKNNFEDDLNITLIKGIASYPDAVVNVWGVPGENIGGNTKFDKASTKKGVLGEKNVGEVLQRISDENPHVRVFHGLRFTPGKDGPDIDHCLVFGNRVFLIDAKHWAFGHYVWKDEHTILNKTSNNEYTTNITNVMNETEWKNILASYEVKTLICLADKRNGIAGKYYSENINAPKQVYLTSLENMYDVITGLCANPQHKYVDRYLVAKMVRELQ